jgi:hypothetical protein
MEEEIDILFGIAPEAEEEISGPQPLSDEIIGSIAKRAVDDAVDFIEGDIAPARIKSQRYYQGEVDLGYETGRSKVVATRVRDTVRAIKPSLMRVFLSSTSFVEYTPRGPEDVRMAEQATTYMHWKFNELGGFRLLSDAFHDALVKKAGIVKVFWEDVDTSKVYTFTNIDDMQYTALITDPDVEVIEHSEVSEEVDIQAAGIEAQFTQPTYHDVKIIKRSTKGEMRAVSVPPEEFFIDRDARSIDDCYVCGHSTDMRAGDVIAMGYDADIVDSLDSSSNLIIGSEEEEARRDYPINVDQTDDPADPSMKLVMITEAYMRIDADGTGVPMLHRITLGGSGYKLLGYEPADEIPFAVFEIDPEPHTFFGHSIADLIMSDQDASTAILRGILDNVAMVNNPRLAAVDGQVNMDDLLNNEIGAIVRMRAPGMVQPLEVPFSAGQTLAAMQYMDNQIEVKTGVSRASMGLDPDALQSTTKAAVSATVQAAAGQVETMARNLAEGGMRQMFGLMLRLMVKNSDAATMMRLNNTFQSVDPRVWDADMDVTANVGLGTGREEEKAMAYREVFGIQTQIMQAYGPSNGMVSLTNMRNTLADSLASAGIRNADRYFMPMNAEIEAQMMQAQQEQAQQAQGQQQPDPNAAYLQAEQMKAQAKQQSDAMDMQLKSQKMMMDDDRARDQMAQDLAIKAAELLAKTGVQIDQNAIKREQAMNNQMPMGGM